MRKMMVLVAVLSVNLLGVAAEDWPNWRGPNRDGISSETNLPVQWSTTEGIAWKLEMPAWSGSTPIISGNYIFLNAAEGGKRVVRRRGRRRPPGQRPNPGTRPAQPPSRQPVQTQEEDPLASQLALWCVDRRDGKILWKRSLGGGNRQQQKQNMSSPSPVTDGKHVWVLTGTGILKGFDFEGNELWSRDIQADYGPFGLNWGYAASPLLHDGTLYVQVLHGMKTDDPSYVMAVDAATGETRWRVERPTDAVMESPDSYTTPALLEVEGKREIVISGGDYVTGHDAATGREIWRAGGLNPRKSRSYRIVASPVIKDGFLYVPSRQNPLQAFRISRSDDATEPELAWSTPNGPDVPTPVTDGRYIYVLRDNGVILCLDAKTGETIWGPERVRSGIYSASPLLADGKIYVTSEDGVTTVLSASPGFEVLAENDLEGYTLSSIAVSEGKLFARTEQYLYCIDGKGEGDR